MIRNAALPTMLCLPWTSCSTAKHCLVVGYPCYTKLPIQRLSFCFQGNRLIADCGSTSFSYLDMCDQVLNSSNIAAAPLPVPSSVPAELTAATPVAVVQPVAATPPANASQVASQRFVCISLTFVHYALLQCMLQDSCQLYVSAFPCRRRQVG